MKKNNETAEGIPAIKDRDQTPGYALVGLGNLTVKELLPAFRFCKNSRPVALVSGDIRKAKETAEQYGIGEKNIYNYENFDNIRNDPDIKAVYIVLPNSMHEEFTIRAAQAGKHVLCEKPMTTSVASARRMISACKKAGSKLMIAYRIQYEPLNRLAMDMTRKEKYGKVKLIEMYNGQIAGNETPWRLNKNLSGGGSLPDIGIYCLNTARFLTGEEPVWVNASMYSTPGDRRFSEVEESVLFQMRFPGGTLVNATTSYGAQESRRYRCLAENEGWFGLDPAFSYHGLQMEIAELDQGKMIRRTPVHSEKNQFALEIDHFSECILHDLQPFTPGEEGLQDQVIMEALYRSAKEKKPVKLRRYIKRDHFRGFAPSE